MIFNAVDLLAHNTVRLECEDANGRISTGTGFALIFEHAEKTVVPVLVTNKHVIEGAKRGTFYLTHADMPSGLPKVGTFDRIVIGPDFEKLWTRHPSPDVDLAIFPISDFLQRCRTSGHHYCLPPIDEAVIPSSSVLETLHSIEEITMVGYPNGIWDKSNNLPMIRRGITATNPRYDYNGSPVFVIDCACFPGSSGSPVYILNQGSYTDNRGNLTNNSRVLLLGILFAGPQHIVEGEIKVISTPFGHTPISISQIPNNLGIVVKARTLLDLKAILLQRLEEKNAEEVTYDCQIKPEAFT